MTNEQVMYIGPTLRGVAKSGAVFSGGIPKKLEKLAAKKPIIKNLIVPISGIVQAKKDVDTEGTVAAVAYDRISALSEADIRKLTEGE
ncbi:hypothetical protein D3Z51_05965 [Clostridiaceae bacterium]|jgi:hypothetical protein|uniref:hypothetical protein n=1 Tax=Enterocloster bolteae TaxID=208479 RepID=UPI000ED697AB|nr:hypothetical protein [Enterocloster bolteae]NBH71574.1 hypothetical protein [Clostridiaceae bacterium]RKI16089.1 hypothetical protein D7V81_05480 [bacterium 1XD21-70]